jgi:hypothetical protein
MNPSGTTMLPSLGLAVVVVVVVALIRAPRGF